MPDGTVTNPGWAFTAESSTGLYRAGTGDVRLAINGVQRIQVTESVFVFSPRWSNGATTYTGFKVNATDDASASASLLADMQVGGVSKWKVDKTGRVTATGGLTLTGGTIIAADPVLNITRTWNNGAVTFTGILANFTDTASASGSLLMDLQAGGVSKFGVKKDGTATLGGDLSLGGDVFLKRDAADTLALRNGVNAQSFRVAEGFVDASNYSYIRLRYDSGNNRFELGTVNLGSYSTKRSLAMDQNVVFATDNTYDIGAVGANRPRNLYLSQTLFIGSTYLNSTSLGFASGGTISSTSDGIFVLRDAALTSFNRLQFGGTNASFPSIKRSTTILQARLADDSSFATFQGKHQTEANAVAETPTATHTLTMWDASGTAYKVLAVAA